MRTLNVIALFLTLMISLHAQTGARHPAETPPRTVPSPDSSCAPAMREQMAQEIADMNKDIGGMTARVTMLRSNAGIIQDSAAQSALQIDSDLWLSLIASMRRRADRLQSRIDSCDSGKNPLEHDAPKYQ